MPEPQDDTSTEQLDDLKSLAAQTFAPRTEGEEEVGGGPEEVDELKRLALQEFGGDPAEPPPAPPATSSDQLDEELTAENMDTQFRSEQDEEHVRQTFDPLESLTDNFHTGLHNNLYNASRVWMPDHWTDTEELLSNDSPFVKSIVDDGFRLAQNILGNLGIENGMLTPEEFKRVTTAATMLTFRRNLPLRGTYRRRAAKSALNKMVDGRRAQLLETDEVLSPEVNNALIDLRDVDAETAELMVSAALSRRSEFRNSQEQALHEQTQNDLLAGGGALFGLFGESETAERINSTTSLLETAFGREEALDALLENFDNEATLIRDSQARMRLSGDDPTGIAPAQLGFEDDSSITVFDLLPGETISDLADKASKLKDNPTYQMWRSRADSREDLGDAVRVVLNDNPDGEIALGADPGGDVPIVARGLARVADAVWGREGFVTEAFRTASRVRQRLGQSPALSRLSSDWAETLLQNPELAQTVDDPIDTLVLMMKASIAGGEGAGLAGKVSNQPLGAQFASMFLMGPTGLILDASQRESGQAVDAPDWVQDVTNNPLLRRAALEANIDARGVFAELASDPEFVETKDRLWNSLTLRGDSGTAQILSDMNTVFWKTLFLAAAEPVFAFVDDPTTAGGYLLEGAAGGTALRGAGLAGRAASRRFMPARFLQAASKEIAKFDPAFVRRTHAQVKEELDRALTTDGAEAGTRVFEDYVAISRTYLDEFGANDLTRSTINKTARALKNVAQKSTDEIFEPLRQAADMVRVQGEGGGPFGLARRFGLTAQVSRSTLTAISQDINDMGSKALDNLLQRGGRLGLDREAYAIGARELQDRLGRELTGAEKVGVMAKISQDTDIIGVHDFLKTAEGLQRALRGGILTDTTSRLFRRLFRMPIPQAIGMKNALQEGQANIIRFIEQAHTRHIAHQGKVNTAGFLYDMAWHKAVQRLDRLTIEGAAARELGLEDQATEAFREATAVRGSLERLKNEQRQVVRSTVDSTWDLSRAEALNEWLDQDSISRAMAARPEKFGGLTVDQVFEGVPVEKGRLRPRARIQKKRAEATLRAVERKITNIGEELPADVRDFMGTVRASTKRPPEVVGREVPLRKRERARRRESAVKKGLLSPQENRFYKALVAEANTELPVDELGRPVVVAQALARGNVEQLFDEEAVPILHYFLPERELRTAKRLAGDTDLGEWVSAQARAGKSPKLWRPAITRLRRAARQIHKETGLSVPAFTGNARRFLRGRRRVAGQSASTGRPQYQLFLERQIEQTTPEAARQIRLGVKGRLVDTRKLSELEQQRDLLRNAVHRAEAHNEREFFGYRLRKDGEGGEKLKGQLKHNGRLEVEQAVRDLQQDVDAMATLRTPSVLADLSQMPIQHQFWAYKGMRQGHIGQVSKFTMEQEDLSEVVAQMSPAQRKTLGDAMASGRRVPKQLLDRWPSLRQTIDGQPGTVLDVLQRSSAYQHELLDMARRTGLLPENVYNDLIRRGYNPHFYTRNEVPRLVKDRELSEAMRGTTQVGSPAQRPIKPEPLEFQRDPTRHRVRVVEPTGRVVNEKFETALAAEDWIKRNYGKKAVDSLKKGEPGHRTGRSSINARVTVSEPLGPELMEELGFVRGMTAEATLNQLSKLQKNVLGAQYLRALKQTTAQVFTRKEMRRLIEKHGERVTKDYVELPNDPRTFGSMADHFVHRRAFADISTLGRSFAEVEAWISGIREAFKDRGATVPDAIAERVGKMGRFNGRAMELARSTQITMNERTWAANVTFNATLDHMLDGRVFTLEGMDSLRTSWREVMGAAGGRHDPDWVDWIESGLSGTGFFGAQSSDKLRGLLRNALGLDEGTVKKGQRLLARRKRLVEELYEDGADATEPRMRKLGRELASLEKAIDRLNEGQHRRVGRELAQFFWKHSDELGRRGLGEEIRDMYSSIDEIYRFALYKQLRKRMGKAEAEWHVAKFTQNYRDIPGFVQKAGGMPIFGAFAVGFPYELIRIGANFARYKGRAAAKMAAIVPALNLMSAGAAGVDFMRQYHHQIELANGSPMKAAFNWMTTLNIYNEDGEIGTSVGLDNLFLPYKDLFTFNNNLGSIADRVVGDEPSKSLYGNFVREAVRGAARVGGSFFFNTPVGSTVIGLATGLEPRLGRQIVSSDASYAEKLEKYTKFAIGSFVPPKSPMIGRHVQLMEEARQSSINPDLGKVTGGISVGRARILVNTGLDIQGGLAAAVNEAMKELDETVPLNTRETVTAPEDTVFSTIMTVLGQTDSRGEVIQAAETERDLKHRLYLQMLDSSRPAAEREKAERKLFELLDDNSTNVKVLGKVFEYKKDPSAARDALERLATAGMYDLYAKMDPLQQAMVLEANVRKGTPDHIMQVLGDISRLDRFKNSVVLPEKETQLRAAIDLLAPTAADPDAPEAVRQVFDHYVSVLPLAEAKSVIREHKRQIRLMKREALDPTSVRRPLETFDERSNLFNPKALNQQREEARRGVPAN